jgi:DNA-directed RNA polymerase specialized sigma24 family protein
MNEAEWASVLEECYARVLRALVGVSGSRETAEDGLQDALAAAWKPGVRDRIERPDAWLFRVGVRMIRRGRWRTRREVTMDDNQTRTPGPGLDRVFALELLSKLSFHQRELVVARYFLGLSYRDIANQWDISVGTATSTVSHALERLRNDLQKEDAGWTSKRV